MTDALAICSEDQRTCERRERDLTHAVTVRLGRFSGGVRESSPQLSVRGVVRL